MLQLRPSCEHCDKPLPPATTEARICSFECTFCSHCAEQVLSNVCPNCGGGFVPRPIRPATNWRRENFLGKYPATDKTTSKPADLQAHAGLVAAIGDTPPEQR